MRLIQVPNSYHWDEEIKERYRERFKEKGGDDVIVIFLNDELFIKDSYEYYNDGKG